MALFEVSPPSPSTSPPLLARYGATIAVTTPSVSEKDPEARRSRSWSRSQNASNHELECEERTASSSGYTVRGAAAGHRKQCEVDRPAPASTSNVSKSTRNHKQRVKVGPLAGCLQVQYMEAGELTSPHLIAQWLLESPLTIAVTKVALIAL